MGQGCLPRAQAELTTYISVLRAINLGSHNKIAMSDLRAMLETLGCEEPKTVVLSGNVVFKSPIGSADKVEKLLEAASATHLGVTTDYFVRTAREWRAIIAANPFPKAARTDPGHLVMMCLRDAPSPAQVKALQEAIKGREIMKTHGRQAYFVYPDGIGRSKLTIKMIEKALGTTGTARNWNTVLKLGELAQ
jgi:uncharacterized protein (DUF1697 family)